MPVLKRRRSLAEVFLGACAAERVPLGDLASLGVKLDLGRLTLRQLLKTATAGQICAAGYPLGVRRHPPSDVPCAHWPDI